MMRWSRFADACPWRGRAIPRWLGVLAILLLLGGTMPLGIAAQATATPGATPAPPSSTDWTMYHRDPARTGYVPNVPDPTRLSQAWKMDLDGAVYAQPLVVGNRLIVATEGDSLYALDTGSGKTLWHTNVGKPVPLSSLPCGNIDPLGITGTPVYDPASGLVFVVAEIQGDQGPAHILVGIDPQTGAVRQRRSADVSSMTHPETHQQRAALALGKGFVYIAYGGLFGDCGDYHGTVVGARTDGQGQLISFQVPTPREGAIWGASGPAIDANGDIFIATGNGETTSGDWDHSDSVLRLSPSLQLEDGFAPTTWQQDNSTDADLGSLGPVLLPNGLVFIAGKSGTGYLLRADHLGGVGGQIDQAEVCRAFGGAATVASRIFLPCTDGLREISIASGPKINLGWQAPSDVTGSPIVGGNTVYSLAPAAGTLYALNLTNGQIRTQLDIGPTSRFASPVLSGHRLFVGTMSGVAAVDLG